MNAEEVVNICNESVIGIRSISKEGKINYGSAVVLKSRGIAVTNYHNIHLSTRWEFFSNDKIIEYYGILAYSLKKDLLVFKLKDISKFPDIKLSRNANVGERIYAIGRPFNFENCITDGILNGKNRIIGNYEHPLNVTLYNLYQISAQILPGNSGGGLFNEKGELIGITTCSKDIEYKINYAIPINNVLNLLKYSQIDKSFGNNRLIDEVFSFHNSVIADDFENALIHLNKCIKLDKNRKYFLHNKIDLLLGQNKIKEAGRVCKKELEYDKKDEEVLTLYISVLIREKKNKEAFNYALKLYKLNPRDYDNCCTIGFRYIFLSKYNEAISYFKKAGKLNKNGVDHLTGLAKIFINQKLFYKAGLILWRLRKRVPEDSYTLYLLSELYYFSGKYEKSLELLEEYIKLSKPSVPENTEIKISNESYFISPYEEYMGLAAKVEILTELGRYEEALLEVNELLEKNPDESEFYVMKARIMFKTGNINQAMQELKKGVKINPHNLGPYHLLSEIQLQTGKLKQALVSIEKVLNAIPNKIGPMILKAKILFKAQRNNEAVRLCNKILKINKCEVYTLDLLRSYYFESGKYKLALSYATRLLNIKPYNWKYLLNVADILIKTNDLEESLPYINKAIICNPSTETYLLRANIHFQLRNYRSAINDCDNLEILNKDLADIYYLRGKSLFYLNMHTSCLKDLEKAILINSKYERELRPLIEIARKR